MQELESITYSKQNELAERYPFWFDHIPEEIPSPLLFGVDDYDLEQQASLEDLLQMKGQEIEKIHPDKGTEFTRQTVLSSTFVQKRFRELRAKRNFEARKRAGAVRDSSLGIVGNNLDKCITSSLEKETRAGLYRAQNMIQKVRLSINLEDFEISVGNDLFDFTPSRFEPKPLEKPIVSKTVCDCGKPLGHVVELQRNLEHGSSSVNGVATCGSVWACPVCRQKIISERAEELKEIYEKWDGHMYMLTLTVPHEKGDNLAELYGSNQSGTGISGALAKFRQSRTFSKAFKDNHGYHGDIRGIEVTWGRSNGFHPHIHMLILTEETISFKEWRQRFYLAWRRACLRSDLKEPSFKHGIDLSYCDNPEDAQYLAKWSTASELTSQSMKQAKNGNFSIAELEQCLWDKELRNQKKIGLTKVATVLRAYYGAMHGQRMLQTGGIGPDGSWKKELLEITDVNEIDRENRVPICDLEYRTYIKVKRAGKLPDLLQASERGSTDEKRIENIRFWLKKNKFDPGAVQDHPPNPPPPCFSNITDFDYLEAKLPRNLS